MKKYLKILMIVTLAIFLQSCSTIHKIDTTERIEEEKEVHKNIINASENFFVGASGIFKSFNNRKEEVENAGGINSDA